MSHSWEVRLGQQAEQDYLQIIHRTKKSFETSQAKAYAELRSLAGQDLMRGPEILGTKARDEIGPGIRTLHIGRDGWKERHFIVFRSGQEHFIEVLRTLHTAWTCPGTCRQTILRHTELRCSAKAIRETEFLKRLERLPLALRHKHAKPQHHDYGYCIPLPN